MSDQHHVPPSRPGLVTDGARAVAALVVAVLDVSGRGLWAPVAARLGGAHLGVHDDLGSVALASLAAAGLALGLALPVLRRRTTAPAWEHHVAGAAVVLGALAALVSLLGVVASLD